MWLNGDADLLLDVLHERTAAGDVEHLDAATDCEQRKVGVDGSPRQLELVVVAAGLDAWIRGMRGLAVDRRQDIASTGQQNPVHRPNHVLRPVDRAVEHTDLRANTTDGFFVVTKLVAGRYGNDRHSHLGGNATFFAAHQFP